MGPFTYTESIVARTLKDWFNTSGELFVELYKPHSGGSGFFYVLNTYAQYEDLMVNAKPGSIAFVLRDRQLPIRGIVDDGFIANAVNQIPDGEYYAVIEPCVYPNSFVYLGDGNTHAELKNDLEKLRGVEVWAGVDLNMPEEYWKENLANNALIAKKPE
jgi:hypothetical protein